MQFAYVNPALDKKSQTWWAEAVRCRSTTVWTPGTADKGHAACGKDSKCFICNKHMCYRLYEFTSTAFNDKSGWVWSVHITSPRNKTPTSNKEWGRSPLTGTYPLLGSAVSTIKQGAGPVCNRSDRKNESLDSRTPKKAMTKHRAWCKMRQWLYS